MESDSETYIEHFQELIHVIHDTGILAKKLQIYDAGSVLAALEGTFYMGDPIHTKELADICRDFSRRKLKYLKERKGE